MIYGFGYGVKVSQSVYNILRSKRLPDSFKVIKGVSSKGSGLILLAELCVISSTDRTPILVSDIVSIELSMRQKMDMIVFCERYDVSKSRIGWYVFNVNKTEGDES